MDPIEQMMEMVGQRLDMLASEQNVNLRAIRAGFGVWGQLLLLSAAVEERMMSESPDVSDLVPVAEDTERRANAFLAGDYTEAEACPPRAATTPGVSKTAMKNAAASAPGPTTAVKRPGITMRPGAGPRPIRRRPPPPRSMFTRAFGWGRK